MFAFAGSGDTMRIGPRNVESCKAGLEQMGITLIAGIPEEIMEEPLSWTVQRVSLQYEAYKRA